MAEDIVPGLQEAIEKDFQSSFQTDSTLISIYEKIQNGTATQKDGEAFARELGTVLTDVFHRNVTPEQLPDGRMYYNIANRLIPPALEQNHGLVNEVMRQIITKQNADAGIGLRYQDADLDEDKVHGLVERAANYPQYEVVQNDVETGLTTFTQGVADDAVHKNASFQASAGLHPRIVRETDGDCCKWCLDLAGTYDYESAPPEVYARHANCGCSVEFRPGDGKRQDVWSKALISDAEFAKIDARKEVEGLPDDVGLEQIRSRMQLNGVQELSRNHPGSNEDTIVSDAVLKSFEEKVARLGENPETTARILQAARTGLWHRSGTLFEDMSYVSRASGDVKSQRHYDVEGECVPTAKMMDMLEKSPARSIIGLHNHARSLTPSRADIIAAKRYAYGLVFCHNGLLYKYTVSDDANINQSDYLLDAIQGRINDRKAVDDLIQLLHANGVDLEVL